MKVPVRLTVSALGGLELVGHVELPDELVAAPTRSGPFLTDAALVQRSAHLATHLEVRERDRRRLPYLQPTPGRFLYRLADIEELEREATTERASLRPVRAAKGA